MKVVLLFSIIIIFVILHFTIPSFSGIVTCYDTFSQSIDDLAFKTRAQNWNQERICQVRYDNISALTTCVNNTISNAPVRIRPYFISSYKSILRLIRPNITGIEDQKSSHNTECADYPDYIFE